jgi:hypothetical protein
VLGVGEHRVLAQLAGRVEELVEPVLVGQPGLGQLRVVAHNLRVDLLVVREPAVAAVRVQRDRRRRTR